MIGKIIRGIAGFYYVYVEDFGEYECKAKGIFRNQKIKPLVGDDVEITILDEKNKTGNIIDIKERKSELVRPAVANIDQALVIFAIADPTPNYNLLDRFLVMMERQNIKTFICFNKTDRANQVDQEAILKNFIHTGYQIFFTNAISGEGIEEVKQILLHKVTSLAGPSGVGKSSLTNLIQDEVSMKTGTISEKIKRGKHTTRHTEFIAMKDHTYLLDTPGFSSLYITDMDATELKEYYPEFNFYANQCRFQGCNHMNEPDCKVKLAIAEGEISSLRYENYKLLYEELKNKKKY
jgi:ribosome biogenesis GTPase